jgi:hypothetical protein
MFSKILRPHLNTPFHFRQKSRARPVSGRTLPRADREANRQPRGRRGAVAARPGAGAWHMSPAQERRRVERGLALKRTPPNPKRFFGLWCWCRRSPVPVPQTRSATGFRAPKRWAATGPTTGLPRLRRVCRRRDLPLVTPGRNHITKLSSQDIVVSGLVHFPSQPKIFPLSPIISNL